MRARDTHRPPMPMNVNFRHCANVAMDILAASGTEVLVANPGAYICGIFFMLLGFLQTPNKKKTREERTRTNFNKHLITNNRYLIDYFNKFVIIFTLENPLDGSYAALISYTK